MTNFRRKTLVNVLMLFDLGILALSYLVAAVRVWHLTALGSFTSFISLRVKVLNILLFLAWFISGIRSSPHSAFIAPEGLRTETRSSWISSKPLSWSRLCSQ